MIQKAGGDWVGGQVFEGAGQRDAAYAWALGTGLALGTFDLLTFVPLAERQEALHIVCDSCRKELQNGQGKLSHSKCGACTLAVLESLKS